MAKKNTSQIPTFIKWVGGKKQLIEQFIPLFPSEFNRYFEPFIGGGAVFFYLKKNGIIDKATIMDTNEELINCYTIIRDKPKKLIKDLVKLREGHSEEQYYSIRSKETSRLTDLKKAARFIYLNKTCFNGLYRVNLKGLFNTPIGSYKNPSIFNENLLMDASDLLQGVTIKTGDFRKLKASVKKGDFVYFDPPYYPLNKTSKFTTYTKTKFLDDEQIALRDLFAYLDEKGALVMLSNSSAPFIKKIYKEKGYKAKNVSATRMINSNASKRGAIKEVVIRNY